MNMPLMQWIPMPRKPTAREAITTFLLLLPLVASLLYRLYAKIRRRDGRSMGLQILSDESDDGPVKYEIIAVHGLGASPEHTWTCKPSSQYKTSDNQHSVHLLKDLLMKDERFSDARILHFAYNSDWLVDACFESARDIGLRLIESLTEHRKTHPRLPLIFVGHSFGGIVIKEALSSDPEDSQRILEDTCGIIFLGTPHLGSPVAGFGATLAYLTGFLGSNTGLLLLLRSNGEMLVNLSKAFQACVREKKEKKGRETQIVTICEKKPTYLLNWLYAGKIVPWESATFGANFADVFEVDTDHTGLNKCVSLKDPLYKELTVQLHRIQPTTPPKINTLQQAVLDRLISVTAADAEFHPGLDEYGRGHSECLPQTREEILKDIFDWLDDSSSSQKYLYWLQGKAGTGKSTIARTIASRVAGQNRIAANFFFKRGEGDRAKLKRFFTTLAAQLVRQWPSFAKAVQDALESDPSLPEQDPRIQFKKFIQEPLRKQERNKSKVIIIIVDAHDECDSSEDLTGLVQQLTQSQDGYSTQLPVKCFLTSRFDHHSQSSFNHISEERCEMKELEKSTSATIKQDIERYLRVELEKIDGLLDPLPGGDLWSNPSDVENLEKLTERACPLFEFAAFSTRFIKQTKMPGGPRGRLRHILETKISGDLHKLYGSIIERRFYDLDDQCYGEAEAYFQKIIGSVILLANAVTVRCLAELLKLPETEIREELQLFESVLVVPAEQDIQSPITLFHESFRDFLAGPGTKKKLIINPIGIHTLLASRCHQLLCGALRENMCKLKTPGTHRNEVAVEKVNECLSQGVQYACRFWLFHVKRSQSSVKDGDDWHSFLLSHLLHWLEAMSLLGRTSEIASLIKELKDVVHPSDGVQVKAFLQDAERLILSFRHVIDAAPLQLYSSVLTFAPAKSLVRERFDASRAKWISRIPNIDSQWSSCLQTLEGHVKNIQCVSFSSDGILASTDTDGIVKVWDSISGTCLQTFSMDGQRERRIIAMAFSKAGKLACMAVGCISVWDIRRDVCLQTLDLTQHVPLHERFYTGSVVFQDEQRLLLTGTGLRNILKLELGRGCEEETNLPFHSVPTILSPDGQWVAYAIEGEIRILDMKSKTTRSPKTLKGATSDSSGLNACFSQDNRYFASMKGGPAFGMSPTEAKIWDVSSTICLQVFSEVNGISALAFSQDSHLLGIATHGDRKISIWDWKKHFRLQAFTGHQDGADCLSFSPDGAWLASASSDRIVKIWDAQLKDYEEKIASFFSTRHNLIFKGGQRLAMISTGTSRIQLLDDSGNKCITQPFKKAYSKIAISANGSIFAAVSDDRKRIEIWDAESEKFLPSCNLPLDPNHPSICSIALSANGQRFIIGLTTLRVEVWESRTGRLLKELQQEQIYRCLPTDVAISSDGEQFAWTGHDDDYSMRFYTEKLHLTLPDEFYFIPTPELAFSPNGKRLAAVRSWRGAFWDVATGACLRTFNQAYPPSWSLDTSFINFDFTMGVELPESKNWKDCLTKYHISPDGAWIMRNREKLLWILPEYRPKQVFAFGSKLVIGRASGLPFAIKISDEDL
ncbi:uncharacterized protein Triagg1_3906 [Trichoderma aggressivum f. europaeum]|uniref:Mitochondrial division protein 1 n=1 Tax=Trichoderma aggressivum f. europaeum TaxID=173218 RepID=A0AAE1IF88_9HYPO|nr:hypothetical protein Triagg1_3906 [Trichoderma aggressivum f. europaeum]